MMSEVLRATVADTLNRTGFPAVHLTEVNFQAMYEQQQAQQDKPEVERPLSPASDRGGRRRGGRSGKARQQGSLAVAGNKILDTEHLHEPALQRTTEQLTAAAAKGEKALGNHLDHVWHNHLAKVLSILDDG